MLDTRLILSGLWVATMLTYLWGDVLRMFSGDVTLGEFSSGVKFTQGISLSLAALMVVPIVMVVLSLLLPQNINRWVNIIVAIFWLLFNLVGLPGYPGYYDKFLLVVSIVFNGLVIWYAWKWV